MSGFLHSGNIIADEIGTLLYMNLNLLSLLLIVSIIIFSTIEFKYAIFIFIIFYTTISIISKYRSPFYMGLWHERLELNNADDNNIKIRKKRCKKIHKNKI